METVCNGDNELSSFLIGKGRVLQNEQIIFLINSLGEEQTNNGD